MLTGTAAGPEPGKPCVSHRFGRVGAAWPLASLARTASLPLSLPPLSWLPPPHCCPNAPASGNSACHLNSMVKPSVFWLSCYLTMNGDFLPYPADLSTTYYVLGWPRSSSGDAAMNKDACLDWQETGHKQANKQDNASLNYTKKTKWGVLIKQLVKAQLFWIDSRSVVGRSL